MTRYKLTIEYDGTEYRGWQRQEEGIPTVQAAIENAVKAYCQQEVTLHVTGRTDAGVHARAQVAHFDLDKDVEGFDLAKAINAHLRPQPITILKAEKTGEDFHARYSAQNKLYQYRIINRPGFPALDQNRAWHMKRPLNAAAMHEAAQVLLGHHDFSTFRDSECQAKSPDKTLDRLDVTAIPQDLWGGQDIFIEAEAKSFLHHQVRNMVGSLVMVGEGKWNADDLRAALKAKDRTKGGPTAPAAGLYLMRIDF